MYTLLAKAWKYLNNSVVRLVDGHLRTEFCGRDICGQNVWKIWIFWKNLNSLANLNFLKKFKKIIGFRKIPVCKSPSANVPSANVSSPTTQYLYLKYYFRVFELEPSRSDKSILFLNRLFGMKWRIILGISCFLLSVIILAIWYKNSLVTRTADSILFYYSTFKNFRL